MSGPPFCIFFAAYIEKMKLLGYRPTIHDPCVFTHPRKGLVLLHVDDFYVLTPTESTELYEALRKDL